MGANDHLAEFFRGKTLAAGFCGTLFHGRLQSNAFNRADFRKAGPAKDEARLAAFSGRAFLLWHVWNLPHIFLFAMPSRMSVVPDHWQMANHRIGRRRVGSGPARVHHVPKYPFNFCATGFAVALSSRPARRSIRAGSMQAIFAVRTTDGAGRPARTRSTIVTSHDHGALSALVIIATETSPKGASLRLEMTSAGRRFSARRSA